MNFVPHDRHQLAAYWQRYFADTFRHDWTIETAPPLMGQHFGLAIAAAGPAVFDGRVLDAACGHGRLGLACAGLGAQVLAVDGNPSLMSQLHDRHVQRGSSERYVDGIAFQAVDLHGRWEVGDPFDVVFVMEALQCLPLSATLGEAWSHVAEGGRLVFTVPWAANPIIEAAHREHRGMFQVTGRHELVSAIRQRCDGHSLWHAQALHLADDQRYGAYALDRLADFDDPPYRVLVTVTR
ncbi:class I SAM-dependent methyltransferase [Desertimonas flava]|uniref:class I SAM-dependent methyltransferase n=1 Tax=Desertimonas flava TaxID=2064846 RepID=UPI000E3498F3|nr:class I SAM-dependent methyltransferase [Desertimonas flava]